MTTHRQKATQKRRRQHLVFLGDLQAHSIREICQGAAQYAAGRPYFDFDPWPVHGIVPQRHRPQDVLDADCLIAPSSDIRRLYGHPSRLKMPYVSVLDHERNLPSVEFDDGAIGRMAAEHLLARGYRTLAFVGSSEWPWSKLRSQSFTQRARENGVTAQTHEFPSDTVPIYWSGNSGKRRERLRAVLRALPKPCGVFAANDVIACFVIETARFYGIGIPKEIGVLGVDDDPVPNAAAGLAISSVIVPFREMGRRATELLDRLLQERAMSHPILLPPSRVVVRTSTDAFMVDDPLVRKAQAFIEANRQRRLKVGDVAKAASSTRVTLSQRFGRHLGVGVAEYILQRRIEYAKDLLRTGELNVNQVSQACGFPNSPFFFSVFKRVTGTTPGKVRAGAKQSG